jgi:hypothetical protein
LDDVHCCPLCGNPSFALTDASAARCCGFPTRYKYLLDGIRTYEPEKKLKRAPRCVKGGYAEFNLTFPALCSAKYVAERRPVSNPVSAGGVDVSMLSWGATPTISRFQPAVASRREKAEAAERQRKEMAEAAERQRKEAEAFAERQRKEMAEAAERQRREEEKRAAAMEEARKRREEADHAAVRQEQQRRAEAERERAAAAAAAAESIRLQREQAEREAAAEAAARAAWQRREEEARAVLAAEEAVRLWHEEQERARWVEATSEAIRVQPQKLLPSSSVRRRRARLTRQEQPSCRGSRSGERRRLLN